MFKTNTIKCNVKKMQNMSIMKGAGSTLLVRDLVTSFSFTHFQVTLSVFIATDCFMWGCPQNHQATIQGRQRQKASQTP